ncbi:MAG: restriction endonuclease subunit S [Burkholderiales bacterium]
MMRPQVRFKDESGQEFPEWRSMSLGEIAKFSKGKGLSKAEIDKEGLFPCIRYGELYTEYDETIHNIKSRTNIDVNSHVLSEVNDVIMPASGETQIDIAKASCVQLSGVILGGDLNIIKSNENGVFLSYYLNSQKKLDIAKLAQGNSVVHLYSSQLKLLDLNLPIKPEQAKIANFLTAIDEKITHLTQKHTLLTQYKKGVMQQIFSQQIRFKDEGGGEFAEWSECTLKDIAQIVGGGTPETGIKEYWNGDIQWFTPTELKSKYATCSQRTITELGLKCSSAKILPIGALLFSSRATVGDVSIALNECTTNQGFQSLIVNDQNNNEFIYYWILNNRNTFLEKASGSTFLEISKREIEKLLIQRPSIKEQTKIANFLTAIDDKITATQAQLTSMKHYKQGLLQQMFV